jgi:multidrug efflux pump subunit AcrB
MRQQVGAIEGAEKLEFGGGRHWGKPISIALSSNNLDELRGAKEKLKAELRRIPKLKDVMDDDPLGLREVRITLKEKAFALGLTTADVLNQVRMGFFGGEAQRVLRGTDEVKIWVRYAQNDRSSVAKLEDMRIRLSDGREYPLREIADFHVERGVIAVNHVNGQRVVTVEADLATSKESVPNILKDIEAEIMPGLLEAFPEVRYSFEGESYENEKTMKAIGRVVPPVLILMFLIVAITFRSFSQAILVFLLIPFSIIGVVWGHLIQGYIVSMLSWFGAIALTGIVINDSLVFVNTMNRLLKSGNPFKEALYEAGRSRFRPVLLTSLTTIAGLGPLIFERSHQAQFLSPMAISVGYGLLFGTLLTLVMLPAMLVAFNRTKVFAVWLVKRSKPTDESVEPAVREEVFVREQSSEPY